MRHAEYQLREEIFHYITQTGDYRPSAASHGDEDSGPAKILETRLKLINEEGLTSAVRSAYLDQRANVLVCCDPVWTPCSGRSFTESEKAGEE